MINADFFQQKRDTLYHHFLKEVNSSAALGKAMISIEHIPACNTESVNRHNGVYWNPESKANTEEWGKGDFWCSLILFFFSPVITYLDISFLYALSLYFGRRKYKGIQNDSLQLFIIIPGIKKYFQLIRKPQWNQLIILLILCSA